MILHPLLLSVVVSDLVGLIFLVTAVCQTFGVLGGWQPETSSPRQLRLERQVEMAGLVGGLALIGYAVGGLLLLVAVCQLLPHLVPGAMCGTGVLQAAGGVGWRALGFRCLALVTLAGVRLIANLNQRTPTAPLARPLAKALLLALPVCGWTFWDTARGFLGIDTHTPVNCCAVVYSQVDAATAVNTGVHLTLPPIMLVGLLALVSVLLLSLLISDLSRTRTTLLLLAATIVWLPLAGTVLMRVFAAYHFEVLAHHCPWCLFLPEHGWTGYPLLGALLLMGMEAPVPLLLGRLQHGYSACRPAAVQRLTSVRRRILLAMMVYWVVGGWPALIWRMRYGVWMG